VILAGEGLKSGGAGLIDNAAMTNRNIWRLNARPTDHIRDGDLIYTTETVPSLAEGQFRLQTLYLSLDPTNRTWMGDQENYMPPVEIGAVMRGVVAGRVVESRKEGVHPGATYAWIGEWADSTVTDGGGLQQLPELPGIDLATTFGALSLVGPTAYFGLLDIGKPQPGETLVVSAAAGGVGQIVGQIGKIKGCRVIGIAGGKAKCDFIKNELRFDAAIDYKSEDVGDALDRLAPKGVDINFEQVGGTIMKAVMARMRRFGRVPVCGLISGYNGEVVEAPTIGTTMFIRRLLVEGFIVTDYAPRFEEAHRELAGWLLAGTLKTRLDIRPGLENACDALKDLFTGDNFGKLLIEVTKP